MRKIKLGDVLDVKRGASLSGEFYSEQGERIRLTLGNFKYPGGGFKENTSKKDIYFTGAIKPEFILKKGDIITPLTEQVSGLLGETARVPKDDIYIQSGDIGLVIPNERALDKDFAYYLVSSPVVKKQLDAAAQQTKIRHTSPDAIKACEAYLPELLEQKKIAALLDAINGKIANNNAICADLEGMAKLLYDYWFVQFDFPDENGKPYKSSGGKMVWNEELKREIPEGWTVVSYRECIQSVNTGLNPRDNFKLNTGGNIRYLTVKNLTTSGNIDFASCDFIDDAARNIVHRRSDISIGDVLFASIAPLGRCFLIDEEPIDWDINESVFSIRPNYQRMTSKFLYMTFMGDSFIKKATNSSTGSVFKGIRINDLMEMKTILPPMSVLQYFDEKGEKLFATKSNCVAESVELTSMRDFLLPMLMNGQIKVKGA